MAIDAAGEQALADERNCKPEKSPTDRAFELLFLWIGANVRPQTVQSDTEELAREAVRWVRALESEVTKPTERSEEKPRVARRAREDEEDY